MNAVLLQKSPTTIVLLIIGILIVFSSGYLLGTQQLVNPRPSQPPVSLEPILPSDPSADGGAECRIQECHGLDLSCGYSQPIMCTMEYYLGDACRQFARCEIQNNGCQLALDPEFNTCKQCVEQCMAATENDLSLDPLLCEQNCLGQFSSISQPLN